MEVEIHQSLAEVDKSIWNQLGEADYPFTRHEFLLALELNHCLSEFGWQPVYFLIIESGTAVAAIACYIKSNGYGELVFDNNWAQAYERSGIEYYPKLVSAIPYTPATGPRFLIHQNISDQDHINNLTSQLISIIKQFCKSHQLSGWHCLFERESILKEQTSEQLLLRYDCQYHWLNHSYSNFDDFLSDLNSRKRKNIKKERSSVDAEDLTIVQKYGDELSTDEWARVHQLYARTFERKYGTATLTKSFFQTIGAQLNKRVMVVLALDNEKIIAASLFFKSDSTLFGRLWGCDEFYNHLHFECCYYQGIDYCIKNGLQHFDPGAQGEHKISRGFLPTRTCSAHWFPDDNFHQMIKQYLNQEEQYINDYCTEQSKKSPFKKIQAE
ncbi:MAG: GNAT family N-acetyltransferase [Gammaproteobacteria bacterium]|nr:GNAT family N-acetyltransferase [Gammaproteobacteria bacterium]MBT3725144.1 GNAT family N-acetyltransferase [Gammaproteobacteria bacterium]MBT4076438.1 GNAT family N-acetyltransferase [Gammaproteobacteria bacterium]MBT4193294.1 GNAT family N-acetyltransferase [Gammaproteobacteria bacterium]MBT4449246.1 GNAT family N-acetyltransferase [Gammaproteobacteria bacterium]